MERNLVEPAMRRDQPETQEAQGARNLYQSKLEFKVSIAVDGKA
jgi:hypothetical protein